MTERDAFSPAVFVSTIAIGNPRNLQRLQGMPQAERSAVIRHRTTQKIQPLYMPSPRSSRLNLANWREREGLRTPEGSLAIKQVISC